MNYTKRLLLSLLLVTFAAEVFPDTNQPALRGNLSTGYSESKSLAGATGPAAEADLPLAADLSLEEWRDLIYLYSRLKKPKMVKALSEQMLKKYPGDKQVLQLLVSFYLDQKDRVHALPLARTLTKNYPEDIEAQYSLAMAYQLDAHYEQAREVLSRLKAEHFRDRPFPYESDLASVATLSGHWIQAVGSYQEVLRNPLASPDIRNGARKDLDDLYRNHLPQLLLSETYVELRSGSISRTSVDYNRPLNGTYRFGLLFERDDVTLEQAPFLRSTASDRYDVSVRLEAHHDHAWHSKIWLGTTDQGALYGGQVTRLMGPDRDLNLAFHANQRATDSLLLETLAGRQDELSLRWNTLLPLQITLSATLQGRRVFVDDATLGDGYGLYLQLERSLFKEPDVRIGYRGIITHFSFSSQDATLVNPVAATGARQADKLLILDNLASSINLHGLYLSLESHLTQQWSSRLRLGSDYSFERSSFGYDIEGSLSFFPRRGSEFTLEIGHSTSATTSDRDSERLQFSLAIRNYF